MKVRLLQCTTQISLLAPMQRGMIGETIIKETALSAATPCLQLSSLKGRSMIFMTEFSSTWPTFSHLTYGCRWTI